MTSRSHPNLVALIGAAGMVLALARCVPESPSAPAPGAAPTAPTPTATAAATPAPTVAPAPTPTATPTPEPPPPVVLNEVTPGISTTPDGQIVVEWEPDDTAPPNLFDLEGRTLAFTPVGNGGYSRSVRPLAWEENIGRSVEDGAEVRIQNFGFDFAGRSWDSFFVSRRGLITFGEELKYRHGWERGATMQKVAANFVTTATISVLYKPQLEGRRYVYRAPDRVVVTWIAEEPWYFIHGFRPAEPSRFQLVLRADGGVHFNYANISWRDGIVGLFPNEALAKGNLIASLPDARDPELPGHLDILEVAIYTTNTDAVLVEFRLRGDVPDAPDGESYAYRLWLDTDEPYFPHPVHWSDGDLNWSVDVGSNGRRAGISGGLGVARLLSGGADNHIAFLVTLPAGDSGISAGAWAEAVHFDRDGYVQSDGSSVAVVANAGARSPAIDLSLRANQATGRQSEVFRYRSVSGLDSIMCGVIDVLGDEFDVFAFHSEVRMDRQETGTPFNPYGDDVEGLGTPAWSDAPCGSRRLKGRYGNPVWIKSKSVLQREVFNSNLFFHEFTHKWTAHASYLRNGRLLPLFEDGCECHWRPELHLSAAFPRAEGFPEGTIMGGKYWRENDDDTFTPIPNDFVRNRHSWLDLYMMGLAEAREVPDMVILRNLRPLSGRLFSENRHAAERETVTIEQIIAAEGPRIPAATDAQKNFNAAFVYLVDPGQTPDAAMLRLHADWLKDNVEHWSLSTGGRSRFTTRLPGVSNRPR